MPAPTVIVEDGTGLANANSYVTVAEAQAYYDARLYPDKWNAQDADKKAVAVINATRLLDQQMKWFGYRKGTTQALDWPRIYVPDRRFSPDHWAYDPLAPWPQYGAVYPSDSLPQVLKDATSELAGELLKVDRTAEWGAMGVSSVGLGQGAVDVTFTSDAATVRRVLTKPVMDALTQLGVPKGVGANACVTRAG